jgi:glycerol-3-phosphate acyltransferase PlsY
MNINQYIIMTGICIFAYLLGSVPFGLILVKKFKSVDLRLMGSGNIGASNARRAGGWALGFATLACDVLKGAIPVFLAGLMVTGSDAFIKEIWISLTAISAFTGHLFPLYLKFKTGGKGVATAAGCMGVISPLALAAAFAAFVIIAGFSNRVSAGSLAAAAVLPAGIFWTNHSLILTGCALTISLLIIARHKDNIKRLLSGTEPAIWDKKSN